METVKLLTPAGTIITLRTENKHTIQILLSKGYAIVIEEPKKK